MPFSLGCIHPKTSAGFARILLLIFLSSFCQAGFSQNDFPDSANSIQAVFINDSILKASLEQFQVLQKAKDTTSQINLLLDIAHIYGQQANYKNSYDYLWQALLLAEESNNLSGMATAYLRIARHYGFYGRRAKAEQYFEKALEAKRKIIANDKSQEYILVEAYHSMCSYYRDYEELEMQKAYLDSCYMYADENNYLMLTHTLGMEKAVIESEMNNLKEAEKLFNHSYKPISERQTSYLVIFEYYQAKNYERLGMFKEAEEKLNHAIMVSNTYHSHLDFIPKIYKSLSGIYKRNGQMSKSIDMLYKMNQANFNFFDSRSENNRPLLDIQDEQRVYKEKKLREIELLKLEELENTKEILFLQRTILIMGLLVLFALAFYYVNYLRKKHKIDKQLARIKQNLELKKIGELVELKNKELAASALKLIEKEQVVKEFSSSLKKNNWEVQPKLLKSFVRSWGANHNRNWDEFQKRFVDINSQFYINLHEKFPALTSSDDKLCALIKLKFSSKQISDLMGISNESVHTTRSRLRKKMGLSRDVNLTDYLSQF